jgi:hypothetical protein
MDGEGMDDEEPLSEEPSFMGIFFNRAEKREVKRQADWKTVVLC